MYKHKLVLNLNRYLANIALEMTKKQKKPYSINFLLISFVRSVRGKVFRQVLVNKALQKYRVTKSL